MNLLFFLFLALTGRAEEVSPAEPLWVSSPKNTVLLEAGLQTIGLNMSTFPEGGSSADIRYKPNSPSRTHLGLGYDNLGLSVNFANPVDKTREHYYGESVVNDYHLSFFGQHHHYSIYYQNYSGYYAEDSNKFNPAITDEFPRIQRPDITSRSYGFEYVYNFSPGSYSLEAAYGHSAQQIRSGASFVAVLNIIHSEISAERPLVDGATTISKYGEWQYFKGGQFLSLNPGLGGGGTFAYKRYYATGLMTMVYGPQKQKYELNGEKYDRWVGNVGANLKIGLGYNGEKYFSGFQVEAITTNITINQVELSTTQVQGLFFVGSRFFEFPVPALDSLNRWLSKPEMAMN